MAVENSGGFQGLYHVLHGTISPLEGMDQTTLRSICWSGAPGARAIGEIVVATNATIEGDATAMEIRQRLNDLGVRVTRLARGLATGGDIEYVDAATIAQALEGRREI